MPSYRIGHAAALLGVSADTVRRWADSGRLPTTRTEGGQRLIEGAALARFAREVNLLTEEPRPVSQSARNRMPGIVTDVVIDKVAAKVEVQAGPFRLVSLMTAEAAEELGLQVGVAATAVVKATSVVIEAASEGPG